MAENITAHMDKSLESLKHNFSKVRTGRANANICLLYTSRCV